MNLGKLFRGILNLFIIFSFHKTESVTVPLQREAFFSRLHTLNRLICNLACVLLDFRVAVDGPISWCSSSLVPQNFEVIPLSTC